MASSSTARSATKAPVPRSPESYVSLQHRNAAAEILQSYEKLSWYSFQRCESLTQTRIHFQNVVAGFTAEDEAQFVDWREDRTPHGCKTDAAKSKGKERVSFAADAGGGDGVASNSAGAAGSVQKAKDKGTPDGGSAGKGKGKKRRSGEDG